MDTTSSTQTPLPRPPKGAGNKTSDTASATANATEECRRRVYKPILASAADSESIVFIDTVNAFFAWYYKTLNAYNRSRHRSVGSTVDANDTTGLASLKAAFETTFRRGIRNILELTGASSFDIIFAIDCQRNQVWRHDLLWDAKGRRPVYKATRVTRSDAGIGVVMRFLYDDLLPRLLPGRRVEASRAEADDVIGVIARLVNHRAPTRRVYVISDDSDFVQLMDHPSTEVYTQRLTPMRRKYPSDAREFLNIKCLMGDRVDNIDAAFPRCGPKTAKTLLSDPRALAAKIKKYGRVKMDRNRRLIDFDYIPTIVRSRIIERALLVRHAINK